MTALASDTVKAIFGKLLVRYGREWMQMWPSGIDARDDERLEQARVHDWCYGLAGITKDRVIYAMANLPEKPPTLFRFKALCMQAPVQTELPQIEGPRPKADPGRLAAELERARAIAAARNPRQWAHDLQERERNGEHLTAAQRMMWRSALEKAPADFVSDDDRLRVEDLKRAHQARVDAYARAHGIEL